MNYGSIRKYLQCGLIVTTFVLMMGCANNAKTVPDEAVSKSAPVNATTPGKSAAVSIIQSTKGEFIIQGNNMDDISGFEVGISYDSAVLSSPTVTKSGNNSGALMAANTTKPGTIKFVMISTSPFSGTVPLATVSFATVQGQGELSITSISLVNSKGVLIK